MQPRSRVRKYRQIVSGASRNVNKASGTKRPKQVSQHHQLQLLHKSIKKAKQFELRKLIRRLKAVTPASAGTQDAEATQKLQTQYDATKHLNTEVVLQQAAATCCLPGDAEQASAQLTDGVSQQMVQLACNRLLAATCVKQQMQAITVSQKQIMQPAASDQPDSCATLAAIGVGQSEEAEPIHFQPVSPEAAQDELESNQQTDTQQDQQLAENAITRLIASRAAQAQSEAATSSADEASDSAQSDRDDAADDTEAVSVSSADDWPAEDDQAHSMPASLHPVARDQPAVGQHDSKLKTKEEVRAKLKVKEKDVDKKKKKKKNRLGQRARQQLGRAKQGQTMGFVQSNQQFKARPTAAAAPGLRKDFKPKPKLLAKPMTKQAASTSAAQPESLHPSWAAKQHQKQALLTAAPAGRKTVFSDDGQTVTASRPAAEEAKKAVRRPEAHKTGSETAERLHPSWAAKRAATALKVDLSSAPKAHKIVFED